MDIESPRLINRELSWLEFNQRVLEEARDEATPLLERLKFLAITSSNLDEFFMVRVGGLQLLRQKGSTKPDPSGLTPVQQLDAVGRRTQKMVADQYACFLGDLEPKLAEAGVKRLRAGELTPRQQVAVELQFDREIYAVLTPMAVASPEQFPLLTSLSINVCVRLKPAKDNKEKEPRYAVIPFGRSLRRFVTLPADRGYACMLLEDVVAQFVTRFFPGEEIVECVPFRITRNADLSIQEDSAPDLLDEMQEVLDARKESPCVRLEIAAGTSDALLGFLMRALNVGQENVFALPGPLDLSAFMQLIDLPGFDALRNEPWPPQPSPQVDPTVSMFDVLSRRDVLLVHPYESFDPVARLIEEAADDPNVLAIKQVLYRTSRDSPIVAALRRAAERGKHVTAIVELKARFDEARNIEWARRLEQASVQVIYGVKGLKTHAKVCVIVRREPHGIQRYVHFGTGNYNEITARLYSDVSFMTSNEELGADATSFFNSVTGYSQPQRFRKIEVAPLGLRDQLLEMIDMETQRKKHGQKGYIAAKLNSLVDPQIIEGLYAASQAGVKIDLNIRGICCLRPGVTGLSENITVVSIVDRFLEHSRIIHFHHGGDERVFISSADWMPRNLDRRVELLVPIEDRTLRNRLMDVVQIYFRDTVKSHRLLPDGSYERVKPQGRKKRLRCQEEMYRVACEAIKLEAQSQRTTFEPHRSPDSKFNDPR